MFEENLYVDLSLANFSFIQSKSFLMKSFPVHSSEKLNFSNKIMNCSRVSKSSSSVNLKPREWVLYSDETTIPSEVTSPIKVSLTGRFSDLTLIM